MTECKDQSWLNRKVEVDFGVDTSPATTITYYLTVMSRSCDLLGLAHNYECRLPVNDPKWSLVLDVR